MVIHMVGLYYTNNLFPSSFAYRQSDSVLCVVFLQRHDRHLTKQQPIPKLVISRHPIFVLAASFSLLNSVRPCGDRLPNKLKLKKRRASAERSDGREDARCRRKEGGGKVDGRHRKSGREGEKADGGKEAEGRGEMHMWAGV